jgi:hypothetical protein
MMMMMMMMMMTVHSNKKSVVVSLLLQSTYTTVDTSLSSPREIHSIMIFFVYFQVGGGGYNGLSNIKTEQDGMASLGSMKVGHLFSFVLSLTSRRRIRKRCTSSVRARERSPRSIML